MDATERNRRKRSINTAVAAGVLRYGFSKTKNHWFVRAFPDVAQFMHLHFYTFNNHIRIHLGYRILADRFEAIALNGPHFQGARVDNLINPKTGARYEFGYNIIGHKEVECADEIVTFFEHIAVPYFDRMKEHAWSGLPAEHRALFSAVSTDSDKALSRKLLNIK
jgi:hypothetical protein